MTNPDTLLVYLAGHIHGGWRDHVRKLCAEKGLEITFKGPCEDHGLSDDIGVKVLGVSESNVGESGYFPRVKDDLGGRVNDLRTEYGLPGVTYSSLISMRITQITDNGTPPATSVRPHAITNL